MKNLQKFSGGDTPDPLSGRARPPAPTPSTATRRARGRKLTRCWDLGLGNRSPKSKFTTRRALSDAAIRPYVRLSVPPGLGAQCLGQLGAQRLGQLGAQRLGQLGAVRLGQLGAQRLEQVSREVQTADPSRLMTVTLVG